jgi:hypothetical protein
MSKYLLILFVFLASVTGIYSCHKDVSFEQPGTGAILKLLQNTWSLTSITEYSATGMDTLRYIGSDSDYFKFTVNDSVYSYMQQTAYDGIYALLNDTTLIIGDGISYDTAYITKITGNLLVFHSTTSSGDPFVDSLRR